jgi:hypothetical protein
MCLFVPKAFLTLQIILYVLDLVFLLIKAPGHITQRRGLRARHQGEVGVGLRFFV